ncbi:MAG: hypothetical protein HOP19_03420 [Acidobacteria bacterium]|nr:hypothetical protein [Acidobacteriota bacterium]
MVATAEDDDMREQLTAILQQLSLLTQQQGLAAQVPPELTHRPEVRELRQSVFTENIEIVSRLLRDLAMRQDRAQDEWNLAVKAVLGLTSQNGSLTRQLEEVKASHQEASSMVKEAAAIAKDATATAREATALAKGNAEAIKELRASQQHSDGRLDALINSQIQTDELVVRLMKSQAETGEQIKALAAQQAASHAEWQERFKAMAAQQAANDQRFAEFMAFARQIMRSGNGAQA